MSRLIPTPNDVFRKIDHVVDDVNEVLARVDITLASVDTTLGDATAVLRDVRDLLGGLSAELAVLEQVPRAGRAAAGGAPHRHDARQAHVRSGRP